MSLLLRCEERLKGRLLLVEKLVKFLCSQGYSLHLTHLMSCLHVVTCSKGHPQPIFVLLSFPGPCMWY